MICSKVPPCSRVGRTIQETEFTRLKQTTTTKAEVESAQQKASKDCNHIKTREDGGTYM